MPAVREATRSEQLPFSPTANRKAKCVPTDVILTGTGVPIVDPDRAGPGVLVRTNSTALQFDAGRATSMRLAVVGTRPENLTALFVTHYHSDHLVGLADIVLSRWMQGGGHLDVVAPAGPAVDVIENLMQVWAEDIAVRKEHVPLTGNPQIRLAQFQPLSEPVTVWKRADIEVSAVRVHHEPVVNAVAYRVDTCDGGVVFSGDTVVCAEVEALAHDVDVLVHEVFRRGFGEQVKETSLGDLAGYHADSVALGAMAQRAQVRHLMLTHLIPPPLGGDYSGFVADIREGGYTGDVIVGPDLTQVRL